VATFSWKSYCFWASLLAFQIDFCELFQVAMFFDINCIVFYQTNITEVTMEACVIIKNNIEKYPHPSILFSKSVIPYHDHACLGQFNVVTFLNPFPATKYVKCISLERCFIFVPQWIYVATYWRHTIKVVINIWRKKY